MRFFTFFEFSFFFLFPTAVFVHCQCKRFCSKLHAWHAPRKGFNSNAPLSPRATCRLQASSYSHRVCPLTCWCILLHPISPITTPPRTSNPVQMQQHRHPRLSTSSSSAASTTSIPSKPTSDASGGTGQHSRPSLAFSATQTCFWSTGRAWQDHHQRLHLLTCASGSSAHSETT